MMRFVVVVDTQWDCMAEYGALSVADDQARVAPMKGWISAAVGGTAGVLFTFDTHDRLSTLRRLKPKLSRSTACVTATAEVTN